MHLLATAIAAMLFAAALPVSGQAASAYLFAPGGCDYSVSFPEPPRGDAAVEVGGRSVARAELSAGGAVLRASCTTGYPEGSLSAITDGQLLAFVDGLVRRMGVSDALLRPGRSSGGRFVQVSGVLVRGGERLHTESRFYYGRQSRLIVEALSLMEAVAAAQAASLFASVSPGIP